MSVPGKLVAVAAVILVPLLAAAVCVVVAVRPAGAQVAVFGAVDPFPVEKIPKKCGRGPRPGVADVQKLITGQVGGGSLGIYNCRRIAGSHSYS